MDASVQINMTEGVSGGYPCIGDTRIAVRLIVESFRKTGDVRKTAAAFPQVTMRQVDAALTYYVMNPDIVNEDIARNERTLASIAPAITL
jgi:uncharacterized protein (DUF433 family)